VPQESETIFPLPIFLINAKIFPIKITSPQAYLASNNSHCLPIKEPEEKAQHTPVKQNTVKPC
jgi:hypothetical protein